MIGEAPLDSPSYQLNPITDAVVTYKLSLRPIGASGIYNMIAPLPASENALSPYTLEQVAFAMILSPNCKL
jgi:hypothetical protein